MLRHPCILWDPQNNGGQNQKWLPHTCLLGGPQVGGHATSPLHSRGSQNKGGQNQKSVPHPCLLGSPKKGGNATSPLHCGAPWLRGQNQKWLNWGQGQNFGCAVQKNSTKKTFAGMVCLRRKTPLRPPPQSIFKKGGGFQNPPHYRISQNPPPGAPMLVVWVPDLRSLRASRHETNPTIG